MKPRTMLPPIFLMLTGLVYGQHKHSPDLEGVDPKSTVNVIIRFTHPVTDHDHRKVIGHGGTAKSELHIVQAGAYTLPASEIESLAADPEVAYIAPDRPVKATLDYARSTVGADVARSLGYGGAGVGVAVIDSGVSYAMDFQEQKYRVVYSQNFADNTTNTSDAYEHGSHVAGIIAGNGYYSSCNNCTAYFRGIAGDANIVNLRVLDQNGVGTDSAVIAAIQQAINLKNTYNIRVINLSLGRPVFESYTQDPLCQAVESAWNAGIVVVVAAGNGGRDNSANTYGYGTITSPGNDPYVITVGAMKTEGTTTRGDDLVASYSSKGPTLIDHIVKPDIVAPGNRIISVLASTSTTLYQAYPQNTIPVSYYRSGNNNNSPHYYRLSGTI